MKLNSVLDISIAVILSDLALELTVQPPEALLDLCTATEHALAELVVLGHDTLIVESTANSVLVGVEEFVDHVPEKLDLCLRVGRHRRAKVAQIVLAALYLLFDFLRDERQVDLDVREENLRQLFGQSADTKVTRRHVIIDRML